MGDDKKKDKKLETKAERRKELANQGKQPGKGRHEHRETGQGEEVYK